ncbi:MAG TPA: hypothetical protein VF384_17900 [Planctomycetota bacterium]
MPAAPAGEVRDWRQTYDRLRAADARGELEPQALEMLAEAARWTGDDAAIVAPLERAHAAHTARRDATGAARTALSLVWAHRDHRRDAVASTWLTRAAEVLDEMPEAREHGWLAWFRARGSAVEGDVAATREQSHRALELARRHGDRGLEALALMELAHVAGGHESTPAAFALAEQATAIVLAGEAGILPAGEVLCATTWLCRTRGAWDRAQQWIELADRWVERQGVQYFPGMCRMHRSEVLRIRGRLDDAERESLEAIRMLEGSLPVLSMIAFAELGEVRRRRGNEEAAIDAFGKALQLGWDPQPGMALVLLATGHGAEAMRVLERVFRTPQPTYLVEDRANLLAARTTVALANADLEIAGSSVDILAQVAEAGGTAWEQACSAEARGRLELARGRVEPAIDLLSRARRIWTEIDAPFELATTCVVLGDALARAGDKQHARLSQQAACEIYTRLGSLRGGAGDGAERRLAGLHAVPAPAAAPVSVPAEQVGADSGGASLVREGDYWSVCFEGRVVRIREGRGVSYLAALLARPGEPLWAVELAAGPADAASGRADLGDAGLVLDAAARQQYARRLRELEEELDDAREAADPGRVEAARSEMDALGQQLAAAVGLGGRGRRSGGAAERARQSVTKAIRSVLKRLAEEHPPLGEHLQACVRTGTACVFTPDRGRSVVWTVRRG